MGPRFRFQVTEDRDWYVGWLGPIRPFWGTPGGVPWPEGIPGGSHLQKESSLGRILGLYRAVERRRQ